MPDLVSNLMVSSQGKEEEASVVWNFSGEIKKNVRVPGKRNRTVDGPLRVILGNGIKLFSGAASANDALALFPGVLFVQSWQ